jgi:hypothetical protein
MRALMFAVAVSLVSLTPTGCGGKKDEVIEPSGPPPLPSASGSVIGYLIDAKSTLSLRDDQLTKLEKIDSSLAARNGQIDAQLRMIEKPAPGEQLSPQQMKAGEKEPRYNNAPGASTVGTDDSMKLHKLRDQNDADAIKEALALLDPDQQEKAKRIFQDRGVTVPGAKAPAASASDSDSGQPLPGMEP